MECVPVIDFNLPELNGSEQTERDLYYVMPLAIPVISGPGSISAMIIATQLDKSFSHFIAVCCAAVTVGVASWFLLHISDYSS